MSFNVSGAFGDGFFDSADASAALGKILLEDGSYLLREDGGKLVLETG